MTGIFAMTDTWDNVGTAWTAIKMNVTNTASASGSLVMDLLVDDASVFSVSPDSVVTIGNGSEAVELRHRGSDSPGIGVPVFRAAAADTPTALDVFPNGAGSEATGRSWIHVLAHDLTDTPTALAGRWQAAILAARRDVVTVGAMSGGYSLTVTGGSGTGSVYTATFAAQTEAPFEVGDWITVSGIDPSTANGNKQVTACTTTSVSYSSSATTYVSGGTIELMLLPVNMSGSSFKFRDAIGGAAGTEFCNISTSGTYFGGSTSAYAWANSSDMRFKSGYKLQWGNNASTVYGTGDTALARASAGVLKVTNASTGNGALTVSYLQTAEAYTVATLPGTPAVGMIARVTDADTPAVGSTVTGGAAAAALVWYNGSAWTVIGV